MEHQKVLHGAWVQVLGVDGHQFDMEADFLHLEKNSVAAINLSSRLRGLGYVLSVGDALRYTNLKDMSEHLVKEVQEVTSKATPFQPPAAILEAVSSSGIQAEVESFLPCPPGQTEFLTQGARPEQNWTVMAVRQLPQSTSIEKWLELARQLAEVNEILRTTFLSHEGRWYGVVLKDATPKFRSLKVSNEEERKGVVDRVWASRFGFGCPFLSYTFVHNSAREIHELVIKLDHGSYNGTLLRVFDNHFRAFQKDQSIAKFTPFSEFASHTASLPKSRALDFWTSTANRPTGFRYPEANNPCISRTRILTAESLNLDSICRITSSTPSTVFQASFQLWLSRRNERLNVSFDYLYTGRNVDLPDPQTINGTCANFLPLRAEIDPQLAIKEYLSNTQTTFWEATGHGIISIDEIYASNNIARASNANTALFLFQPFEPPPPPGQKDEDDMRWLVMAKSTVTMPQPYALVFEIAKMAVGWKLKLGYNPAVIQDEEAHSAAKEIMGLVEDVIKTGLDGVVGEVLKSWRK